MKKIALAVLLSAFVAAPAFAADGKNSVGVNYGMDINGTFGIQGEFDVSSSFNKAPVSVQVFWKKASETYFGVSADTTALGVAGIYDLSSTLKLDKKIQPYAGAGIRRVTATVVVPGFGIIPNTTASASDMELHLTIGAKYSLTPEFSADLNYNDFGGLTFGAEYKF